MSDRLLCFMMRFVLLSLVKCKQELGVREASIREVAADQQKDISSSVTLPSYVTKPTSYFLGYNTTLVLCRARFQSSRALKVKCRHGVRHHHLSSSVLHTDKGVGTIARMILTRSPENKRRDNITCHCEINNENKSKRTIISFLKTDRLPELPRLPLYQKIAVYRRKSIRLRWQFQKNVTSIECYHDGTRLEKGLVVDQGIVEALINNTSGSDAGIYTCSALSSELCTLWGAILELHVLEGWSEWEIWLPCSTKCGIGRVVKRRFCLNTDQTPCHGRRIKVETCEASCREFTPLFVQHPKDTIVKTGSAATLYCTAQHGNEFQLRFRCKKLHGVWIRDTARVIKSFGVMSQGNTTYKSATLKLLGPKLSHQYMAVACHCEAVAWGIMGKSKIANVIFASNNTDHFKNWTMLGDQGRPSASTTVQSRLTDLINPYTMTGQGFVFLRKTNNTNTVDVKEEEEAKAPGGEQHMSLLIGTSVVACLVLVLFLFFTFLHLRRGRSLRIARIERDIHRRTRSDLERDVFAFGLPIPSVERKNGLLSVRLPEINKRLTWDHNPEESNAYSDSDKRATASTLLQRDSGDFSEQRENNFCIESLPRHVQPALVDSTSMQQDEQQNFSMLREDGAYAHEEDVFDDDTVLNRQGSNKSHKSTFSAMSSVSKASCPRPVLPDIADERFCAWGRIDHNGGCLAISNTGIRLYIPAMALPEEREEVIFIALMNRKGKFPELRPGQSVLSPVVVCGPDGLQFDKPVYLTVPHNAVLENGDIPNLKGKSCPTEPAGSETCWTTMGNVDNGADGEPFSYVDGTSLQMMITHFTNHVAVGDPKHLTTKVVPFSTPPTAERDCSVRIYCIAATEAALEVTRQNEERINGVQADSPKVLLINNSSQGVHVKVLPAMDPDGWTTITDTEQDIPFRDLWEGIKDSPNVTFGFARTRADVYNFRKIFEAQQSGEISVVKGLVTHSIKRPATMSSGYESIDNGQVVQEPKIPRWALKVLRVKLEPSPDSPIVKSWKDLAEKLGMKYSMINYLDKGKSKAPTDELFAWWEAELSDKVPLPVLAQYLFEMGRQDAAHVVESIYSTEV